LWKEPPSGSGKKYFAGYTSTGGYSARQQINVHVYKRLLIGQTFPVEYLPEDPAVSQLILTPTRNKAEVEQA
jgi:hypothetical protein